MQFESVGALWGLGAAMAGVIALHLLSWRRPQPRPLPTARFLPAAPRRAVSRRLQPSEAALLALRLLALAALGLAVAGPVVQLRRPGLARVIAADRSRSVASPAAVQDSVTALESGASTTRVFLFDSLTVPASDAAWRDSSGRASRGNLDAALVTAIREATDLGRQFDSVEIVIVSPVHAEEVTPATSRIRGTYRGAVRHVRPGSRHPSLPPALASAAWPPATDPLGAALRLASGARPGWLRVSRGALTPADSAHATNGGVLLHWPDSAGAPLETAGVLSRSGAVVGSFARHQSPEGRAVAWWSDGRPAAAERPHGAGCVRAVRIGLPRAGDAVLRPAFQRLVRDLVVPCGWYDASLLTGEEYTTLFAGPTTSGVQAPAPASSPLTRRLLLLLALLALAAEWWVRRRRSGVPDATGDAGLAAVAG